MYIYYIHTLQQPKFYYQMVHKNLPIYFNTLPLIRNRDIHGHNTRCRNKIGTVRTKHEFAKRCIRYSLAHTINRTYCIQDKIFTHSLNGLSIYSKHFLLNKYESNCQVINCYICSLTRFNKIATQGAPQMAVDKEANSLSRVYSYYSKFNLRLFYV